MARWLLPTLGEVLASRQQTGGFVSPKPHALGSNHAKHQWQVAIAALQSLLQHRPHLPGINFTAPVPIFSEPAITFSTAIFSQEVLNPLAWMPLQLPGKIEQKSQPKQQYNLAFLPGDPIATEQFCLVFTPEFSVAIVLSTDDSGEASLWFSFDPEDTLSCWSALKPRILLASPHQFKALENLVQQYPLVNPN